MISALIEEQREQMSSCSNASPRLHLRCNQILMPREIQFPFLSFEDRQRVILETGEKPVKQFSTSYARFNKDEQVLTTWYIKGQLL